MTSLPAAHPDDSVGQLAEQLTCAFRRMRVGVASELAPLGVTFSQARLLRMLAGGEGALRIGDIASALRIAPRSATGMVDSLENAGLARRGPDPADRRSVLVSLTPDGTELLGAIAEARRAGAEDLFRRLGPSQRDQLLSLLLLLNDPDADTDSGKAR